MVFDLDDTLYKEIDYLRSAYREIALWIESFFGKKDILPFMQECYNQDKDVFGSLNLCYGLDIPIDIYLYKYRTHIPSIVLSEEVENMLSVLKKQECVIGLITDGRKITQWNKIHSLGLERYIDKEDCIISEVFGYAKPSQEGYLYFQHKYPHAEYYYIGDNVTKDFVAPYRLGWTTVCLKDDGRNVHKQMEVVGELKAKYMIENWSMLIDLIVFLISD